MHFENIDGHEVNISELKSSLRFDEIKGLSSTEAKSRITKYGSNELPQKKVPFWKIYLAPLFNIMISVYLVIVAVYFILTIWNPSAFYDAVSTLIIIGSNFVVAVIQQYRSTKKIDALHKLSTPYSNVLRDGVIEQIESKFLVPGDIIKLETGSRIPADCRILESNFLEINESILTGESEPVEKRAIFDGLDNNIEINDRVNMIFQGTYVHVGNATAVVVKTGGKTEIGSINDGLNKEASKEIHLVKKINNLGYWLTVGMLVLLTISILFKLNYLYQIKQISNIVIVSKYLTESIISTISIIPINIPILTTIILVTGVYSMAKQKVVIKNLSSIESLGRISVLCSDKTGTITKGQMNASKLFDGFMTYNIIKKGYENSIAFDPEFPNMENINTFEILGNPLSLILPDTNLEFILLNSLLNNESELIIENFIESKERSWKAVGNPTDAALLSFSKQSGLDETSIRTNYVLQRSYPFDSRLKLMSKIFTDTTNGTYVCFTKGAPEFLLQKCNYYADKTIYNVNNITSDVKKNIENKIDYYASQGYRVISFAFKTQNYLPENENKNEEREHVESDLIFLGLVCLIDPAREGVDQSVRELYSAGITPIMITGDNPSTATTIAKKIGIATETTITHKGSVPFDYPLADFNNIRVFSRVSPEDKVDIIKRFEQQNRIVAMTGDGVNDSLAISKASVGVAMGISGTELTKQSSDIVITDDSYNSIVTGIREGRNLYYKIRMVIFFYVAIDLAEALVYFLAGLMPGFFILDFWQRAYIFQLTHFLPPLGLIFDRKSKDIMKQRPLDSAEIFNKHLVISLLIFASVFSLSMGLGYIIGNLVPITEINKQYYIPLFANGIPDSLRPMDWSQAKARTYLLTIIYITECLLLLSLRRMDKNILSSTFKQGWWFIYFCAFTLLVMHVLIMYYPPIQIFTSSLNIRVDIIALGSLDWLICIVLGLLPIIALELYKKFVNVMGTKSN